jgi:glycine oxidase
VNSWDVVIAGAGLAGLCAALELRQQGANVLVLDRSEPGREASSAAAGMLAPEDPETPLALRPMATESARLYPEFVRRLEQLSGCSVDFRRQGAIVLGEKAPPTSYRPLTRDELHRMEPQLKAGEHPAFSVAEDSVDPVLLMHAAVRAAQLARIEIRSGVAIQQMRGAGSTVEVVTDHGTFSASAAVNCMGAWSGAPVRPRKGQMLNLQPSRRGLLEHVLRTPEVYLVPRSSGKILVGTTVEDVGFDKSVNPDTIRALHGTTTRYLPDLSSAVVSESWAGLRPGSPDNLPIIGRNAEANVFIASGLFRNGILLAPLTGKIVADLVMQRPVSLDISAFSPARFAPARART